MLAASRALDGGTEQQAAMARGRLGLWAAPSTLLPTSGNPRAGAAGPS